MHEDVAHEDLVHEDVAHEDLAHEDLVHEDLAHESCAKISCMNMFLSGDVRATNKVRARTSEMLQNHCVFDGFRSRESSQK